MSGPAFLDAIRPRTLTTRLVVTVVALVALACVLVGVAATVAMRGYLTDRLDTQVEAALQRLDGPRGGLAPDAPGLGRPFGQGPGTMIAVLPAAVGSDGAGVLITDQAAVRTLDSDQIARLASVPTDGEAHTVRNGDERYRVIARQRARSVLAVGLPTDEIDHTLSSMITWFALLTLVGVGTAGLVGTLLVRRQLEPLRAVAETARGVAGQDLTSGDTAIADRVDQSVVDEESEVGQVGAALNTLLDHVDAALAARHRSEQQARQFVADASHELRTPLSTIGGYAELSRRTPDDAAALLATLAKVETESERMSRLVEDLLLLARLDAGRPLADAPVDLTQVLVETVDDARVLASDHRWRLDLPDEPVEVRGDEDRLRQVVRNLVTNARMHTPANTTVTVGCRTTGDSVQITVADDGPGIHPALAGSVFERFTRGDSSRTRSSGGSGLGLSLVAAIAAAHGGRVAVESDRSVTTFTVTLPDRPPPAPAASEVRSDAEMELNS